MKRALFLVLALAIPAAAQTPTPAATATPAPAIGVTTSASSGPVSAQLQLDKNKVELGQSLRVTLDLRYPSNLTLTPIPADKFDFKPFDVQDARSSKMPAEASPGAAGGANGTLEHLRYSFKIAPFDTGPMKIPTQNIPFTLNGKEQKVALDGPIVEVSRITPGKDDKPDEIRDLKALETSPFPRALLVALVLAGLLLLYLLVRFIAWLRRPKLKHVAPPIAPYPWAQQELSRLEKERPDQEGRFEEFYERLTMILRVYLGWRYRRSLLEQTTSETLASLGAPAGRLSTDSYLSEDHWRDLRTILEQADLAKFAAMSPSEGRTEEHIRLARHLIENNAPFEEHTPKGSGPPSRGAAGGATQGPPSRGAAGGATQGQKVAGGSK